MPQDMFARRLALVVGSADSQWNALGSLVRWFAKSTASMTLEDHSSVDVDCIDGSEIQRATVKEAREALAELLLEPARVNVWAGDLYATHMHCSSDFRRGEYRIDIRISSTDRLTADGLHDALNRFLKAKAARATVMSADAPRVNVTIGRSAPAPVSAPSATATSTGPEATAPAAVGRSRRRALWEHPWALAIGGPVISGVVLALLLAALLPK